jgi:hypothetical protein
MTKINGVVDLIPNRALAWARANAQSLFAFSYAMATSERNGSPANKADENLPLATG